MLFDAGSNVRCRNWRDFDHRLFLCERWQWSAISSCVIVACRGSRTFDVYKKALLRWKCLFCMLLDDKGLSLMNIKST